MLWEEIEKKCRKFFHRCSKIYRNFQRISEKFRGIFEEILSYFLKKFGKFPQIFHIFEFHKRFWKIKNYQRKSEKRWEKYWKIWKNITARNLRKLKKMSASEKSLITFHDVSEKFWKIFSLENDFLSKNKKRFPIKIN